MRARYSDGRTALSHAVAVEAGADGLVLAGEVTWAWRDIARVDDGGPDMIVRRTPESGERLTFAFDEAESWRGFAPHLFAKRAQRRESAWLAPILTAIAASLAAFLIGVPFFAAPISRALPERYREHLADIAWRQVDALSSQCEGDANANAKGYSALDSMFARLRRGVHGAAESRLEVVHADFPNALTLPDNSIVITDALLRLAEGPDEIAGVLAHELGHVEAGHPAKAVVRQLGVGMFVDVVLGGAGAGQAVSAVNVIALRYSREDEAEADRIGARILDEAGLDPGGGLARLFARIAAQEHGVVPELLSSHPDTGRRATMARAVARPDRAPALSPGDWQAVRRLCSNIPEGLKNGAVGED